MIIEPGRELDQLIAEKVFDYTGWTNEIKLLIGIPNYSTNIRNAWEIVEKIRSLENIISITSSTYKSITDTFESQYECSINAHGWLGKEPRVYRTGKSAEHVICLAALDFFK